MPFVLFWRPQGTYSPGGSEKANLQAVFDSICTRIEQ